jgi:hypothetical protein
VYEFIAETAACIAPPREEPINLAVSIEPGVFSATVTVNGSGQQRCGVALQTPYGTAKSARSSRKQVTRWRTISQTKAFTAQETGKSFFQFSTELPSLYRAKSKGYSFRAVSRCPGKRLVSPVQTVVPPRTDAVTIGGFTARDWLTELIRNFRNQGQ